MTQRDKGEPRKTTIKDQAHGSKSTKTAAHLRPFWWSNTLNHYPSIISATWRSKARLARPVFGSVVAAK